MFEAPGVEPVFLNLEDAISYAEAARGSAPVRFAFGIPAEQRSASFGLVKRIEDCAPTHKSREHPWNQPGPSPRHP
jgi:hypothetical protein